MVRLRIPLQSCFLQYTLQKHFPSQSQHSSSERQKSWPRLAAGWQFGHTRSSWWFLSQTDKTANGEPRSDSGGAPWNSQATFSVCCHYAWNILALVPLDGAGCWSGDPGSSATSPASREWHLESQGCAALACLIPLLRPNQCVAHFSPSPSSPTLRILKIPALHMFYYLFNIDFKLDFN